jgi:hypothetical protein
MFCDLWKLKTLKKHLFDVQMLMLWPLLVQWTPLINKKDHLVNGHRCTGVENLGGGGVLEVFAKIPRGVKAFWKKLPGGPPILGFTAFLLTSFLKSCLGGCFFILPSPLPPVCIYNGMKLNRFTSPKLLFYT